LIHLSKVRRYVSVVSVPRFCTARYDSWRFHSAVHISIASRMAFPNIPDSPVARAFVNAFWTLIGSIARWRGHAIVVLVSPQPGNWHI